jgi:Flp pilus assembly pilin Flp
MTGRIRGLYRKLVADVAGVSAVEFALVVPFLGMVIIGVVDISRGYASRVALQQAVQTTLEKASVGTVQTDYENLRVEAAAAAKVSVDKVTLDTWLECNRARQPLFSGECQSDQMVSRYVSITVNSGFKPTFRNHFFGVRLFNTSADGMYPQTARAVLRVQ